MSRFVGKSGLNKRQRGKGDWGRCSAFVAGWVWVRYGRGVALERSQAVGTSKKGRLAARVELASSIDPVLGPKALLRSRHWVCCHECNGQGFGGRRLGALPSNVRVERRKGMGGKFLAV